MNRSCNKSLSLLNHLSLSYLRALQLSLDLSRALSVRSLVSCALLLQYNTSLCCHSIPLFIFIRLNLLFLLYLFIALFLSRTRSLSPALSHALSFFQTLTHSLTHSIRLTYLCLSLFSSLSFSLVYCRALHKYPESPQICTEQSRPLFENITQNTQL